MAGRCDCDRTCACAFTSSESVSRSGNGTGSQPYVFGVRRKNDDANLVVVDANGVQAYMRLRRRAGTPATLDEDGYATELFGGIETSGGTPLVPDVDGIYTLPAGSTPTYGQGLTVPGSGPDGGKLVPGSIDGSDAAGIWPLTDMLGSDLVGDLDSAASFMGPVVRYGTNIWGLPDHTSRRATGGATTDADTLTSFDPSFTTTPLTAVSIANPSPSRRMNVMFAVAVRAGASCPVGGQAQLQLQTEINGGAWTAQATDKYPVLNTGTNSISTDLRVYQTEAATIAPSATFSIRVRGVLTKIGVGADDPVFLGASARATLLGVTI